MVYSDCGLEFGEAAEVLILEASDKFGNADSLFAAYSWSGAGEVF